MEKYIQFINKLKNVEKQAENKFIELYKNSINNDTELFHRTVILNDCSGIEEYSDLYYFVYDLYSKKQIMVGTSLREEFTEKNFNHIMLKYGSLVSEAYLNYWLVWCKHVNSEKMIEFIKNNPITNDNLLNIHTTLYIENNDYKHKANYNMFTEEIDLIFKIVQDWINELGTINLSQDEKQYIEYLNHYSLCLKSTDINSLNSVWKKLDELWCDIKNPIQLVHNMEYGYEEPTRSKISPDFSIRFLDPLYQTENNMMINVNTLLKNYFSERSTERSRNDLKALTNSFSGVYYIPIGTGSSCFFRIMGQAIPNDTGIRNEKGVKIYCDHECTMSRLEMVKEKLMPKVFSNEELKTSLAALKPKELLVYSLGGHEFGHTIYNLEAIENIDAELKTILEEPRADRVAFLTMKLAYETKLISDDLMKALVRSYLCEELRRFSNFNNNSLKPYIISATGIYKLAQKYGYLVLSNDFISLDDNKAYDLVNAVCCELEEILNSVDNNNLTNLNSIKNNMEESDHLIKWLVDKLKM
jgi:hypothetical protein